MANSTCLAAARNRVLGQQGWDVERQGLFGAPEVTVVLGAEAHASLYKVLSLLGLGRERVRRVEADGQGRLRADRLPAIAGPTIVCIRSEEHTSELQSLMSISYAVFCLKKKKQNI